MPDPRSLDEAISQAVKCDNRLFQRRRDKRSLIIPRPYTNYSAVSTSTKLSEHAEAEDMQIDALHFKPFSDQEKKRRRNLGLCLYCGKAGHKVDTCAEKQNRPYRMRSATTSTNILRENKDVQPQ